MIRPTPMSSGKREMLDIINNITGGVSILPCVYFWSCSLAFQLFHVRYNPAPALIGMVAAVPLSAVAGRFGWRAWYLVTAASAGTFLFFILTHFVD
jgi:hypothetical protein